MNWATPHIESLKRGTIVQFRPKGDSMSGRIENGQLVTVHPVDDATLIEVGDIVLVTIGGWTYVHLVKAINGPLYQIGNNRGRINGWAHREKIHGKVIKVEP